MDFAEPGGHLGDLIEAGSIQLIKSTWLTARAEARLPVIRRQSAPPEACWEPQEALKRWKANTGGNAKIFFFFGMSYSWCSPGHPDEAGFHLQRLARSFKGHQFSKGIGTTFVMPPEAPPPPVPAKHGWVYKI